MLYPLSISECIFIFRVMKLNPISSLRLWFQANPKKSHKLSRGAIFFGSFESHKYLENILKWKSRFLSHCLHGNIMVHNDEQPFNVPHVNCGLRTFGIHACVAKLAHKPSRPLRGLNYRFAAFSIAYLHVNIFKFVQMLLAKRKLLRWVWKRTEAGCVARLYHPLTDSCCQVSPIWDLITHCC